jgi:hypothetical protein
MSVGSGHEEALDVVNNIQRHISQLPKKGCLHETRPKGIENVEKVLK